MAAPSRRQRNGRFVAFASGQPRPRRHEPGRGPCSPGPQQGEKVGCRSRVAARRGPGGQAYEPSISADGNVVAFTYQFTILPQHGACTSHSTRTWCSPGRGRRARPARSCAWRDCANLAVVQAGSLDANLLRGSRRLADGRYIAYTTDAHSPLRTGKPADDVYRYDRVKGTTVLLSVSSRVAPRPPASSRRLSPATLEGPSLRLPTGETASSPRERSPGSCYLWDIAAKTTERSAEPGRRAGRRAGERDLQRHPRSPPTEDLCLSSRRPPGCRRPGRSQVYRRRTTGQTVLVSVDSTGAPITQVAARRRSPVTDGRVQPGARLAAVALQNSEASARRGGALS